jgi:hypothetical protein
LSFLQPCHDLSAVRCVDAEKILSGLEAIDEDVVLDAAAFVAHHGILGLPHGELADIVGRSLLKERRRPGTRDQQAPHVAHVEKAGARPHGMVFVQDAGVLDRHFPAGKVDQPGAGRPMLVDQCRL